MFPHRGSPTQRHGVNKRSTAFDPSWVEKAKKKKNIRKKASNVFQGKNSSKLSYVLKGILTIKNTGGK
jgi:hypothetical protein